MAGLRQMAEGPEARVGTTVAAGRFFLERLLGRGGMSDVYQATWVGPERPVALKLLRAQARDGGEALLRFQREAEATARLAHPGCTALLDWGRCSDGELYLAMELVGGRSLAQLLSEEGPLAPARAAHLAAGILDAIGAAHRAGIVHRDLKPANVMVVAAPGGEQVKVLDFGIAWLSDRAGEAEPVTQEGFVPGTPAYMSPEQIRGEEVDPRSDLYAVGVLLHEMLAGAPPFAAPTALALAAQHLHAPPPGLPAGIPAGLAAAVARALAKDRSLRPGSAEELRQALLTSAEGGGGATPPLPDLPSTELLPVARRRRAAPLLAPLLAAALGTAWLSASAWRGSSPAPPPPPPAAASAPDLAPAPAARPAPASPPAPLLPPASAAVERPPPDAPPRAPGPTASPTGSTRPAPVAVPRAAEPVAEPPARPPEPSPIRAVRGQLDSVPTPPRATGDGVLVLLAIPWAEVSVAGVPLGETPRELRLAAGTYPVRAVHPDLGAQETTVTIGPGERTLWTARFPE